MNDTAIFLTKGDNWVALEAACCLITQNRQKLGVQNALNKHSNLFEVYQFDSEREPLSCLRSHDIPRVFADYLWLVCLFIHKPHVNTASWDVPMSSRFLQMQWRALSSVLELEHSSVTDDLTLLPLSRHISAHISGRSPSCKGPLAPGKETPK